MEQERFYIVDKEGTYIEFYRYVDLLRHLYHHGMWDVGHNFNDVYIEYEKHPKYHLMHQSYRTHIKYIVMDKHFRIMRVEDLKKDLIWFEENIRELNKEYYRRSNRRYNYYDLPFEFRRDPVPGTSNRRYRRYGRYFRHPRTTQERRAYCREDREFIRAKRSSRNLPSNWDDIYRNDIKFRAQSWKRQKKRKQWM